MCRVSLEQKEALETRVNPASMASRESPVPLGKKESQGLEEKLVHRASWDRRATRVRGGQWGSQALKDDRAPRESRALQEFPDPKACQASKEIRVPQGRPAPEAEWVTRGWPVSRERKERRASQESQGLRDSKESVESRATLAPAEMLVPQECRVTPGFPGPEDWWEIEACQDNPGDRVWWAELPVTSTSWMWC